MTQCEPDGADVFGRELKVVTGEWFLEERSKRFEQGTVLSSDVVKQTIMSSPTGESDH